MAEYTIDKIEYDGNVYKLQDNVSGYVSGGNVIPYLTCGTAAGTAAKTTTLVTGTLPATLTTGTRVAVKFTNSNSIASPTITIGSYGAIAIKRYGTTAPSTSAVTSWNAGNVITLVYDGTYWMMADWTTTNSTYSEISAANITSGSGTSTGLVSGRRAKAAVEAFQTDEKLKTEEVTSGSTYYPIMGINTGAATRQFDTTGISYVGTSGSTINGTAILTLGNNTTGGSGKRGKLTIYSTSQYGATLQPEAAFAADRNIYLPDASGTIALQSELTNYLKKPSGDYNPFGWKLTNDGTDIPTWNPPETFVITVLEDEENPGTFYLTNIPDEVRDAWSNGETLVLSLWFYNQNTMTLGEQRLVNYYVEDDNNGCQIIWFSGVKNIWDATTQRTTTKTITCGIYLDEDSSTYVDGQVIVVSGSEQMYSITSSFTNSSIDARGVWNTCLILTLKNASDATAENLMKVKVFACTSSNPDDTIGSSTAEIYPMKTTRITRYGTTTNVSIFCKVLFGDPQATSTNYLSASYFTVIAPFEMTAITMGM